MKPSSSQRLRGALSTSAIAAAISVAYTQVRASWQGLFECRAAASVEKLWIVCISA